ncbi:MAG: hypothetical protein GX170_04490 [Campylobacteraceae bacterium]|nr:hypothetical protein [Campylobacteraceae bacterium]NLY82975.1 hypothetical protein [Clostridiales bacterium]
MRKSFLIIAFLSFDYICATDIQNKTFIPKDSKQYKALKQKFKVCDEFLNITWIDKKRNIGFLQYEAYRYDYTPEEFEKYYKSKDGYADRGKRPKYNKLYYIDKHYLREYLVENRNSNQYIDVEKLKKYIVGKNLKIDDSFGHLRFENNNIEEVKYFFPQPYIRLYDFYDSYAKNTKNICLVYSDDNYAMIMEGKSVKNSYTTEVVKEKYYNFKQKLYSKELPNFETFLDYYILDLNSDGIEDYIYTATHFYYSEQDNYYETYRKKRSNSKILLVKLRHEESLQDSHELDMSGYYQLVFSSTKKECSVLDGNNNTGGKIITDGINFYCTLPTCNINKKTILGGK